MARRRRRGQPKYGGATRDDQGRYWKDGIEVDRYGNPREAMTEEQVAANTSTPGTGVGRTDNTPNVDSITYDPSGFQGGLTNPFASPTTLLTNTQVPEVGDQSISADDPKNIKIETPETILTQSGDDWGMEDLDDYFGGEPPDDDTNNKPPKLPEETSDPNFSSDYTDSGIQTPVDLEDTLEEETEEAGYIPNQPQTPLYSIDPSGNVSRNLLTGPSKRKASQEKGGVGQIGGRQAQFGRKQMVTSSKKASILAP